MNIERLLDAAKACREAKDFRMSHFHKCGTPGCVIGNYAVRRDLQQTLQLAPIADGGHYGGFAVGVWGATVVPREWRSYSSIRSIEVDQFSVLADYFGISHEEANDLFSTDGCDNAVTGAQAAAYIEQFVEQNG
jgi:hypothetical protein